jgi:hypothetical protein
VSLMENKGSYGGGGKVSQDYLIVRSETHCCDSIGTLNQMGAAVDP